MEDVNQDTTLIKIEKVKVAQLNQENNQYTDIEEGEFKVIEREEQGQKIHFIRVGTFVYSIYKELPVYVTQYTDYRSLIFPIPEGFYVLLIEDQYKNNYDILDAIMDQITTQIYQNAIEQTQGQNGDQQQQQQNQTPNPNNNNNVAVGAGVVAGAAIASQQEEFKQGEQPQQQQKEMVKQNMEENVDSSEALEREEYEQLNTVGKIIYKTGKMVSSGIVSGAQVIQKGIKTTGDFIDTKITDQKTVKIKESTMNQAIRYKEKSQKLVSVSTTAVSGIMGMQIKMAKYAGEKISNKINSGQNKQSQSTSEKIDYLKEVGRVTADSAVNILEALDKAAEFIGEQIGQSTQQVIKKKYGDEAAELAGHGIGTAGNMGRAYKDAKSVGVKKLAKTCAKETAKETAKQL